MGACFAAQEVDRLKALRNEWQQRYQRAETTSTRHEAEVAVMLFDLELKDQYAKWQKPPIHPDMPVAMPLPGTPEYAPIAKAIEANEGKRPARERGG